MKIETGERFRKINGDPADAHKIGSEGVVLQVFGPIPEGEEFAGEYGYVVKFDGDHFQIFIRGSKIEKVL